MQPVQQLLERRKVEDVLKAFAIRLEHDREARVFARDLEQPLRLQALLPERRALAGPPARDEERPCRVLAEARTEERGLAHLGKHELVELLPAQEQQIRGGRGIRI